MNRNVRNIVVASGIVFVAMLMTACANRGVGPQGGPKDETPPKIVREVPENGTVNYKDKTIEVFFDEYIQLDKVTDNVLVSPPQQRPPEVKAIGKRLIVKFEQDLIDSTTYTIDFGSAICDNNEKNPMKGYSFSFSTGPQIDSLQIGGWLLNAENLNPVTSVMVGIHSNLSDTAFETLPFLRIAKTDDSGHFKINNVRQSAYRIYALNDVSKDYFYQPGEGLAVYDSLVTPSFVSEITADTLWRDTVMQKDVEGELHYDTLTVVDTVIIHEKTFYSPDSLILVYFTENKVRHGFNRALREKRHLMTLYFNAPQDSLPVLTPINGDWLGHTICQPNATLDTINYWLTDSTVIAMDTLLFEMSYMKSDSVYQLRHQTDTVRAVYRAPRQAGSANNDGNEPMEIKHNGSAKFDLYRPLTLRFAVPVGRMTTDSIHLFLMEDTIKKQVPLNLVSDSVKMIYQIDGPWQENTQYVLEIDSSAVEDIYGKVCGQQTIKFKTLSLDQYSTLIIKLEPFVEDVVIQVLSEKDVVVRELPAIEEGTKFEYLKPAAYFLRCFIDTDHDGKWTTGDRLLRRKPEQVIYYPSKLTLRANWDFEESWDIYKLPIDKQKPSEIRKAFNATQKKK